MTPVIFIAGTMHQPFSPCGDRDVQLFGLLCRTTLVPDGDKGVRLKSNSPKM